MIRIATASLLAGCLSFNVHAADPATVNGKPVKQAWLDFIVNDAVAHGKQIDDAAKANVIERLITAEVIDQAAKVSDIIRQPDFIARAELAMQELRVNTYIEDYLSKNPIDDNTLRAEYDKLNLQSGGKEYRASHILVKSEDEAKALIRQLDSGAAFARLAKDNSIDSSKDQGGDLGWFQPDTMVKPFGDAVASLQQGSYTTTPVQTEFGWHVIKLDDTREAEPPSFDAVKKELAADLQRQQLERLIADLRAKARIVTGSATK